MKIFLICLCCTLIHIPSIILRYIPFKKVITKKQNWILFPIYFISLVVNAILYYFVYKGGNLSIQFYKYNILIFCVVLAILNGIVIPNRAREHFFTFGLTAIIIYLLMSVTAFVEDKFPIDDTVWQIIIHAVLLCMLFSMLYPILKKLMQRTITPFLASDSGEFWTNIWFIPIAMFFASLLSFPMSEYVKTPIQLICRLLIGAATLFICRSISYDYRQLQKREELRNSLDRQKEYYAMLSEKVEEARKIRHDFKHHISAFHLFLNKKDYDGLTDYLNELSHPGDNKMFIPYTGNNAADGVIYHFMKQCLMENIRFDMKGILKDTHIADMDLCVLLGNALDNAYTACMKVKDNRFIEMCFHKQPEFLTIAVRNSFDGVVLKKDNKLLSRKRDNERGIGLLSMQSICKKYNGDMRIEYDDNVFSVMIMLNNEAE